MAWICLSKGLEIYVGHSSLLLLNAENPQEDLVSGVEPPACLVTWLQEGVAKHSDAYIPDRFLKHLENDFCKYLLTDTSDALR